MKNPIVRNVIGIVTGVDRFPAAWLARTRFVDDALPAPVPGLIGRGSALIATIHLGARRPIGVWAAIRADLITVGYVGTETIPLEQTPPGPTSMEAFDRVLRRDRGRNARLLS